MNDEFQNALAWFRSAPTEWIDSGKKSVSAAAEWIWEVLQGDFNDDASTAQIAVGTVISMIPFVDQLCDARDLVANCRKIDKEPDNRWHWISMVLTLIGLLPGLGSLIKGCLKVVFASVRKAGAVSGITPRIALKMDEAIFALGRFLERPEVVASLKALKWDNPYKYLAKNLRQLAARINAGALMNALNNANGAVKSLLGLVQKWGTDSLAAKAVAQLQLIDRVTRDAYKGLAWAVQPVSDWLLQLARRLDIDADMAHRAYLNNVNPHAFRKLKNPTEEAAAFGKAQPAWVDKTGITTHPPLAGPPSVTPGWPSPASYETFNTMQAVTIPPGSKLYRIVDPTSKDNSICWMTEKEFKKLRSKDDWRRRFAVWAHWNSNGEFVTYVVPPGPGLNVWEGVTASQRLGATDYVLEGGARQIVIEPSHLGRSYIGPRQKTNWSYDDFDIENTMVGVPVQRNHVPS